MKRFMFLTVVAVAVVGLGCGSDSSPDSGSGDTQDTDLVDDDEAKADSTALPIGTFNHDDFVDSATRGLEKYKSIVLKTDSTFHLVRFGSSGGGEFDGTYVFQKGLQTGKRYMTLTAPGVDPFKFEYKVQDSAGGVKGTFLFFRDVRPGAFFIPYKRADVGWCNEEPADCELQNYAKATYLCQENACKACDKKQKGETCAHSEECCSEFCAGETATCL